MMLGAFALGDLAPQETVAVQAHLDGCAECRAEVAALRPLAARLALVDVDRLDDAPVTPPELEDRVFARLRQAHTDRDSPDGRRRRGDLRRRVLVAAAVAVAAAAGFVAAWTTKPGPAQGALEAVAVRGQMTAVPMGGVDTGAGGTAGDDGNSAIVPIGLVGLAAVGGAAALLIRRRGVANG